MQQRLYLLVGYPGAGKTTVSHLITELTGAEHIWADQERRHRFKDPQYSHEENVVLYDALNQQTDDLLATGKSVIFDTNFNFYKDRQLLRDIADKHGVTTTVIHLVTDRELSKHRALNHDESHHTRVLGTMSGDDFDRIAGNLEPPHGDENSVEINGVDLTAEQVRLALGL